MFVLMMVDSGDVSVMGVFHDYSAAVNAARFDAFDPDGNSGNLEAPDPEQVQAFERALAEAKEQSDRLVASHPNTFSLDVRWEAGAGSWDYRIVETQLR